MTINLTDVLAWVGAITGVTGFAWDLYKWRRRGAEIYVHLLPNMVLPSPRFESRRPMLLIEVTNRGALPTTLTHVLGEHYTSFWQRFMSKAEASIFVPQGGALGEIPHVLEPGGRWLGQIAHSDLDPLLATGRVRLGVMHSWSAKGVFEWVRITKPRKPKPETKPHED